MEDIKPPIKDIKNTKVITRKLIITLVDIPLHHQGRIQTSPIDLWVAVYTLYT